jgi:outer membrane receptor protein involved in Fe transport
VIPTNRIASASATLTALLPTLTRPNQLTNNYDAYADTTYSRDNWDYKVNYNPTDRMMVFGRYSFSPMDIFDPLVLGKAGGDAYNGGNPINAGGLVQTTAAGFTYTVSPTFLLDGNVGYTRQSIGANGDAQDGDFGLNTLHIPGTNGVGPNYAGIPGFQITSVANIGNTNTGSPFKFRDNQYTTAINASKIKGAHSLRFGFDYDKYALNHFQPQGGTFGTARGTFGFDGTLTALEGGPTVNNPVNSWASFLLGFPSETGKVTQFQDPNSLRFSNYGIYARDQWQVNSKLTLNYGLRWEYYPIFSHDNYGAVRFDPSTESILIGGEGGVPWNTGASASKSGFAPRFGAAYRLGEKTVIRSGYGISIDPDNMRNQRNAFPSIVNQVYQPANTYQFITYPGVPEVALSNGIPPPTFPTISTGKFTSSPTASLTTYLPTTSTVTFPQNMNRGYVESYNFFIQHEFSPTLTADLGYVGTHAVRTMLAVNINGSAPGTGTAGRQLYPYLDTDLNSYEPYGSLKYDALQTSLKKRIGASLIGVSYTFSKAIDVGDNGDAALTWTYPVATKRDEALAGFDRTHTLQIYEVYQLPFGKGHTWLSHGAAAQILGGFQISATVSRYSGLPFTVTAPGGSLNAAGQTQTANQILPTVAIYGGHDAQDPYFNTAAFAAPTGAVLGNSGRDILRGPGTFNLDANVSRIFSIMEKLKLQIAGEAFNLTNTPAFSNPGSAYTAPTVNGSGQITSYNGFGVITSTTSNARVLQVGGTLRF